MLTRLALEMMFKYLVVGGSVVVVVEPSSSPALAPGLVVVVVLTVPFETFIVKLIPSGLYHFSTLLHCI